MIRLYGKGESRSFRVLWALEEAGIAYEYIGVTLGKTEGDGTKTEQYLKLNPQGKVPVLVHDDRVINESGAIINYIAGLVPDAALMPTTLAERAYYDEVCLFTLTDLEQPLWTFCKHDFLLPEAQRVKEIIPAAHWEFAKSLRMLETYIENKPYVIGGSFTAADILIAQTLRWAQRFEFEVPTALAAYRDALYQRPACQRALAVVST